MSGLISSYISIAVEEEDINEVGIDNIVHTVLPLIILVGIIIFLPFFLRELLEGGNYYRY